MLDIYRALGSRSANVHQGFYLVSVRQSKQVRFQFPIDTNIKQSSVYSVYTGFPTFSSSSIEELEKVGERVWIDIIDANYSGSRLFKSAVEHSSKDRTSGR